MHQFQLPSACSTNAKLTTYSPLSLSSSSGSDNKSNIIFISFMISIIRSHRFHHFPPFHHFPHFHPNCHRHFQSSVGQWTLETHTRFCSGEKTGLLPLFHTPQKTPLFLQTNDWLLKWIRVAKNKIVRNLTWWWKTQSQGRISAPSEGSGLFKTLFKIIEKREGNAFEGGYQMRKRTREGNTKNFRQKGKALPPNPWERKSFKKGVE